MLNTSDQKLKLPSMKKQNKKKHHVVPVTYLKGFADAEGKIYAYRKDEPDRPKHLLPQNIGHRRYYYSQPLPGGGWDHNSLEDFFGNTLEKEWKAVVERIKAERSAVVGGS